MDATKVIIDTVDRFRQRRTARWSWNSTSPRGSPRGRPADPLGADPVDAQDASAPTCSPGCKRARQDPRVKALVVKIGGEPLGLAMVQELRQAVAAFRRRAS